MIITNAVKFKIIEDSEEWLQYFANHAGCRRFVYNHFAKLNIDKFNDNNDKDYLLSYQSMDLLLTQLKKEYTFLNNVHSQMLQKATKDVSRGIKQFFKDINNKIPRKRLLKFKKKYDDQSFTLPNQTTYNYLKDENGNKTIKKESKNFKFIHNYKVFNKPKVCYLKIPKLKTPIKILKHKDFEGEIKNVTFSKKGDCYYVSLQLEQSINELPENNKISSIGIDLGVKRLINTSDNEIFKPVENYDKWQAKLKKAQRKLAKTTKFSNNFKKLKLKINKLHRKISQIRLDYLHKISTYLVNNHANIIVEKLNVKNMTKSAKGDSENHGKNVKQKSGLNRSILEQGWGIFKTLLKYKSTWYNSHFEEVNPKNTSLKCCQCDKVHKENRQQQAVFKCTSCGFSINADFNAALNILYLGLLKLGLLKEEAQLEVNKRISNQELLTNL